MKMKLTKYQQEMLDGKHVSAAATIPFERNPARTERAA
jgi:hypothetical protein